MDEFQNIKYLVKDARHRVVDTASFHLCNVQKQAKEIHSVQSQNSNPLGRGHGEGYEGFGNILFLHLDGVTWV